MKSEMDDLCFRLRNAKVVEPKMPSEGYPTTLGKQAAERINELDKRIRELEEENERLRALIPLMKKFRDKLEAEDENP